MKRKNPYYIDLGLGTPDINMRMKPVDLGLGLYNTRPKDGSLLGGMASLTSDISNGIRQTKKDYTTTKQNVRQIKQDLAPAMNRAARVTKRTSRAIVRKFKKNPFVVYTERAGIIQKHEFVDFTRAMAFRNSAVAIGQYDHVSKLASNYT